MRSARKVDGMLGPWKNKRAAARGRDRHALVHGPPFNGQPNAGGTPRLSKYELGNVIKESCGWNDREEIDI